MQIRITKAIAEAVGKDSFKQFGIRSEQWGWRESGFDLDLTNLKSEQTKKLLALLEEKKDSSSSIKVCIKNVQVWLSGTATGSLGDKVKTVQHFHLLLTRHLAAVEGHRLYEQPSGQDYLLGYYVNETEFHKEKRDRYGVSPAHVTIELVHDKFNGQSKESRTFYKNTCVGLTVEEALTQKGLFIETPKLREDYLKERARFEKLVTTVGRQYLASGTAESLDSSDRERNWWRSWSSEIQMVREGEPTKVVLDVFNEDPSTSGRDKEADLDEDFWADYLKSDQKKEDEEKKASKELEEDASIEVPVHPFLAVFDLVKHQRLEIHSSYLEEYQFDKQMVDKLVLPSELKDLVMILVEHKDQQFQDIIKGKSGGAVVLLTGPPGTGKTLTAEVYAESEEKALYSVQCSQLGTSADDLEEELLKVFARAARWKAVLLLDEADVYIKERAGDLAQNAIVGVFLRVLEYQSSVMFLTTNRPDDVDDAVASRCIARMDYKEPTEEDQRKIWRILADGAGIRISDPVIAAAARQNRGLTGRDVKNLLKLANLVTKHTKKEITPQTIEHVKQFKPTKATLSAESKTRSQRATG